MKAEQKDFAQAREQSTKFFDALRRAHAASPDGKVKQTLTQTLARRDEITSDLAVMRDEVILKLREMYVSLQEFIE